MVDKLVKRESDVSLDMNFKTIIRKILYKKKNVILYGLQRSGTNYFERCVTALFDVNFLNIEGDGSRSSILNKHVRLYENKSLIPEPKYINTHAYKDLNELIEDMPTKPDIIFVLSKDPYSWLLSHKRWAKVCNWPATDYPYIKEYQAFYEEWMRLGRDKAKVLFIRYEDLLTNKKEVFSRIAEALKQEPKRDIGTLDVNKVNQSSAFDASKKQYYADKQYMTDVSDTERLEISECVGDRLAAFLGYEIEAI